jgi:hypothetical protein
MQRRTLRRAALAAATGLLLSTTIAYADTVPADGDAVTPGSQTTIDLGQASPGQTVTWPVRFVLTCAGLAHPDRDATIELALELLAAVPDTLVARKRGRRAAERVSAGAARVLAAGGVRGDAGRAALETFDASLRQDGNALNPGTTADLVAATAFVALLEGML